jgi:hypothetical protein
MAAVPAPNLDSNPQPSTQPVDGISVPYKLTDTNHILIRVKINGKGPFNFIMDTGAPAMILRVPAAEKLGIKSHGGLATLDKLEIEGGVSLKHVQCVVETPYQIEGMNAIGASGVELDGLMGYAILARFRLQIDLTKDHMLWTPVNYVPPPLSGGRTPRPTVTQATDPTDKKEANLESSGSIMKLLGPLVKPKEFPSQYRGFVGIQLGVNNGNVIVDSVLGGSPADKAGIQPGDVLESINSKPVHTVAGAQNAMSKTYVGQKASIVIDRADAVLKMNILCTQGL